jgi:hypothetical protein
MAGRTYIRVVRRSDHRTVDQFDITAEASGRHPYLLNNAKSRYDATQYSLDIIYDNPGPEGTDQFNRGAGT